MVVDGPPNNPQPERCPTCDGTGRSETLKPGTYGSVITPSMFARCPDCQGTGCAS